MKKILKYILSFILRALVSLLLFALFLGIFFGVFMSRSDSSVKLDKETILYLNLNAQIVENSKEDMLKLLFNQTDEVGQIDLAHLKKAIKRAKDIDEIKG